MFIYIDIIMKKQKYPKPKKWTPKYPEKYEGDFNNIITRSSWEVRFLDWCDNNSNVLSYSSEEVIVPYRSPIDNKPHRYFVDGKIKIKDKLGNIKIYLVEIKPVIQCHPPKKPKRQTKGYLNECATFMVNQTKWSYAKAYAKDRGWEFIVLTEYDLGIAKRKST